MKCDGIVGLLLLLSFFLLQAKRHTVQGRVILDLAKVVEYITHNTEIKPKRTLICFDVDDTLIDSEGERCDQLHCPEIVHLLSDLQGKGYHLMAVTARSADGCDYTVQQLKELNINLSTFHYLESLGMASFELAIPEICLTSNVPQQEARRWKICYKASTLHVGNYSKGLGILKFLQLLQKIAPQYEIEHVVLIDNDLRQIERFLLAFYERLSLRKGEYSATALHYAWETPGAQEGEEIHLAHRVLYRF